MRNRSIRTEFDQLTSSDSALHAVAKLALKYRQDNCKIWIIIKN